LSAFTHSAEYYEVLTNATARLAREGPLLDACLNEAPGRRVIDLACGTGLHALFFAERGAAVTAVDLSPDMVAHASRVRRHDGIVYRVEDMRNVTGGPWDLILCLGNSLSLLASEQDLAAMFAHLSGQLAPGGLMLTQTLNYAAPQAAQPRHRIEEVTAGDTTVTAVKSLVPRGNRTLLSLTFFATQRDAVDTVAEAAVLRNWSIEELCRAIEQAGLDVRESFGAFDRSSYDPTQSPDIILRIVKPAS